MVLEAIAFLFFLLISQTQSKCDDPIDLNTATLSELKSLPYITSSSAQFIIDIRPICSPLQLTKRPKKLIGLNEKRLNNKWNWLEDKLCSETCCKADASCPDISEPLIPSPTSIYSWHIGSWSVCSSQCDTGTQQRDITCSDSINTVDDVYCLLTTDYKPIPKQICNTEPCPIYEWITSEWKQCALDPENERNCIQQRILQCYDTANNILADDAKCDELKEEKPDIIQSCDHCKGKKTSSSSSSRSLLNDQSTTIGDITVNVDLLNAYNAQNCNTDNYRDINDPMDKTLIIRRACSMDIGISIDGRTDNSDIDISWFYLDATLQANINEIDNDEWYNNYLEWDSSDTSSGYIRINIPNDGYIGEFLCNLYFQNDGNEENRVKIADFRLFVLFNPYSSDDEVYMSSIIDRLEYVENEFGLIWVGSSDQHSAMKWIYDQFYFPNLEISMLLLNRLSLEYRNNTVIISRQISYAVQQDICYGKWGNGPYTTGQPRGGYMCNPFKKTCVEPWEWTGTTQIFDLYRNELNYQYRVQYCQCFVYAGVANTVGRSLGIGTRPISNFQSAHDSDYNRAIEKYWIYDERYDGWRPGSGDSTDSVWNFHVWNEVYFERKDFVNPLYNNRGWQVIDATPQELSYGGNPSLISDRMGAYQCGPASLTLIKDNQNPHECIDASLPSDDSDKQRFGCFDTEFVISETNANYNFWYKYSSDPIWAPYTLMDSYYEDPWDDEYGTIGTLTNTKKPGGSIPDDCLNEAIGECDDEYLDLTLIYKENEPSDPGMPTDTTYHYQSGDERYRRRRRRRLWSKYNYTLNDLDIEGIEYDVITIPNKEYITPMIIADDDEDIINLYGDDYTFGMMTISIDSFHDNPLDIYCLFTVTAWDYSGQQLYLNNDTHIVKNDTFHFVLNEGQSGSCSFDVKYSQYSQWIDIPFSFIRRHLDSSEIPYIFKFTFSVSMYDTTSSLSKPYESIIEERDFLICSPIFKLKDRIICHHKLKWIQPSFNLQYECNADSVGDGFCDDRNNINPCYDGGDCCISTCIPSKQYKCPYFNCIDDRINYHNKHYRKCPKVSSFIKEMNNLKESSVCIDITKSLIENNFQCSRNILTSHVDNECIDRILAIKDGFGEIKSCFNETIPSLQTGIKDIIQKVIDCIDQYDDDENEHEDEGGIDIKTETDITATAIFKSSDSGVDGQVIVDENGNIFIDLDVSRLDISACNFNKKKEDDVLFGYAIYTKWDYGENDKLSKYGPNQCLLDMMGDVYNPFDSPQCNVNNIGYFSCSIGDLSARFGLVSPDDDNKIVIYGNISENDENKENGFCFSRLNPQSLYQRSVAFYCNDNKSTFLFCAPFQIEMNNM